MKTIEVKGKDHHIFEDREEFTMFFGGNPPQLVENWKDGQVGDWVLADDGGVVQVLFRKKLPHPGDAIDGKYSYHQGYLRTIVAPFFINNNPNTKMDTDTAKHPYRFRFGSARVVDRRTRITTRKTLTKYERVFIFNILHRGFNLEDAYRDAYKSNKSTGTKVLKKALLLIKQERIVSEIKKEVSEAAGNLGITHETVLERIQEFSRSDEIDERTSLRATELLGKAIQTFEPKEKKNQLLVAGYGEQVVEQLEGDIKLIDNIESTNIVDEKNTIDEDS